MKGHIMPTVSDLGESKFLKKNDVEPPVNVTIVRYESINVGLESGPPEMKWCLHFQELPKPLVLNKTNGQLIAHYLNTEDFDGWIGKQVQLYNDPTIAFQGRLTGGIRIRLAQQSQFTPDHNLAPRTDEQGPLPTEPGGRLPGDAIQ
jgi:hypothetical protein